MPGPPSTGWSSSTTTRPAPCEMPWSATSPGGRRRTPPSGSPFATRSCGSAIARTGRCRASGAPTAKLQAAGTYATTVTHPAFFRTYLTRQLEPLIADYGIAIEVGLSAQEIPYPYVLEAGLDAGGRAVDGADLATYFPVPLLSLVGDEIADGTFDQVAGEPLPLALFDGVRVDYSLRRLVHYTGCDWRDVQPWILLTNYHRYVDQFVRHGLERLASGAEGFERLVLPGGVSVSRAEAAEADPAAVIAASPWHRHQMPAYHLVARDADGTQQGTTLVNIGVGPSNAKTITDHLAVLRPDCWLMVGHCGGLRQSQTIGDYVLAHAYLRRDRILDELVPPDVPVPALAEVQVALQSAAASVTGEQADALKRRLRTGTVVTYDDRNWELRFSQERRRINQSRAIAVDMESGTVAAQGFPPPRTLRRAALRLRQAAPRRDQAAGRRQCVLRPGRLGASPGGIGSTRRAARRPARSPLAQAAQLR